MLPMNGTLGNALSYSTRLHALSAFCHRFTCDHVPEWVRRTPCRPDGLPYLPRWSSDRTWLSGTRFHVTKRGELSRRSGHGECYSSGDNLDHLRVEFGEMVERGSLFWLYDADAGNPARKLIGIASRREDGTWLAQAMHADLPYTNTVHAQLWSAMVHLCQSHVIQARIDR